MMNKMRKKGAMRLPKSTTKLKQYFPMIREREDIEREIRENPKLLEKYREWDEEQQEEFLDYCTGVKGVKVLYDAFFKRNNESRKTHRSGSTNYYPFYWGRVLR